MDISQWIGLFIILLAMVFSVVKKIFEHFDRQRNPEKYRKAREEQERLLRELFGELGIEDEFEEPRLPTAKLPSKVPRRPGRSLGKVSKGIKDDYSFRSGMDDYEQTSVIQGREFHSSLEKEYGKSIVSERFREPSDSIGVVEHKTSRGKDLVKSHRSFRDAYILKELLDAPLALREPEEWMSPPVTEPPESSSSKSA